jgi:hypothetical protein
MIPAALAVLALLTVVGLGWALAAWPSGRARAVSIAPAFGLGALVLIGIVMDRVGLRLGGLAGPLAVCVLAAAGGYLTLLGLQRNAEPEPPAQVDQ